MPKKLRGYYLNESGEKNTFFNIFFLAQKNFKTREGIITAIQHLRILSYNSPGMSFFDLTLSRYENMDIDFDKNF